MNILTKQDLLKYVDVVRFWLRGFDTYRISQEVGLPEYVVAGWIANFRDMGRETA